MKYGQKSFSVGGPINVTDEEWQRIFGKPAAPVDESLEEKLEAAKHRADLAECAASEWEAAFNTAAAERDRAEAERDAAQAANASLRTKLLLAEMHIESLRGQVH